MKRRSYGVEKRRLPRVRTFRNRPCRFCCDNIILICLLPQPDDDLGLNNFECDIYIYIYMFVCFLGKNRRKAVETYVSRYGGDVFSSRNFELFDDEILKCPETSVTNIER